MKKIISLILSFLLPLFIKAQWIQLTVPTTQDIKSSSFISDEEGWIGTKNGSNLAIIFHTANGGESWNSDTINGVSGGTTYLEFASPVIGYAVVNNNAYKTIDGGVTWTQLSLPGAAEYEPYFFNEDTGLISASNSNIYKTVDGGETWNTYESFYEPFYSMDFFDDSLGAASGYKGETYGTNDGGKSWYSIEGHIFEWYYAVSFKPDGNLYYTGRMEEFSDKATFIKGENEYYEDGISYPLNDLNWFNNSRCYAVGGSGRIIFTEDEGITWEKIKVSELLGLPDKSLYQVDGFNDVFAFGQSGYAFKLPAATLCSIPTSLFASNISTAKAKLNWDVVSGAQNYSVRYRKSGTQPWTKTTAQLNYKKLIGLLANIEYDWSVKSVCDAANHISSDWSATQNFTTKPLRLEDDSIGEIFVELFPNPTSTTIHLQLPSTPATIMLFNLLGEKVKEEKVSLPAGQAGGGEITIDVSELPAGFYFLSTEEAMIGKFMKLACR